MLLEISQNSKGVSNKWTKGLAKFLRTPFHRKSLDDCFFNYISTDILYDVPFLFSGLHVFENELSGVIVPLRCAMTLFATSKPGTAEHFLLRFLNKLSRKQYHRI